MKKRVNRSALIGLALIPLILYSSISLSGGEEYLRKGAIQNYNGESCWYKQTVEKKNQYFFGRLTQMVGILTFDNPDCMSGSGFEMDVNKMMVNNIISRWYSHSDAKFKTRVPEMYNSSPGQVKGQCVQSSKYPIIGITVDYIMSNNSISKVIHGSSIQGCAN